MIGDWWLIHLKALLITNAKQAGCLHALLFYCFTAWLFYFILFCLALFCYFNWWQLSFERLSLLTETGSIDYNFSLLNTCWLNDKYLLA